MYLTNESTLMPDLFLLMFSFWQRKIVQNVAKYEISKIALHKTIPMQIAI